MYKAAHESLLSSPQDRSMLSPAFTTALLLSISLILPAIVAASDDPLSYLPHPGHSDIKLECSCRESDDGQKPFLLPQDAAFASIGVSLNETVPLGTRGGPIVDLGYSIYEGTRLNNGQNQFLGIRYGAPPTGPNRFKKAGPPESTLGVQSATEYAPVCDALGGGTVVGFSEDCLFMNIWAPADSSPANKYPVFFWLSGGAYFRIANANYNASDLVASTGNDMIFIEINYRVGPFGFLASRQVKRQGGDLNNGLHDQRLALSWVQEHITKFGGDPRRVVLVGDSAGAGSITMHLLAAAEKHKEDLFHGAIGISPFFPAQLPVADLEWQFRQFADRTNCSDSSNTLECLRGKTNAELEDANTGMSYPNHFGAALAPWTPCIDNDLIVGNPLSLFEQGKFRKVPMVWGSNTDEGTLFSPNATSVAEVIAFIQDNFAKLSDAEAQTIIEQYPLTAPKAGHAPYFPSAADAYGDSVLGCLAYELSNLMSDHTDVWYYRYDVLTPEQVDSGLGVFHMSDLPVLFGKGNTPGTREPGEAAYSMTPTVRGYHTNFVRFLNPNAIPVEGGIPWSHFASSNQPQRLYIALNNVSVQSVWISRCQLWRSHWAVLQQ